MIVTLTLNPSLDRTLEIDSLERGAIVRTGEPTLEPGGKGVNVTRALVANGIPSTAVLPVGGVEGGELTRLLGESGADARTVPVRGRTRSNISLAEPDGTITKLNEPGGALDARDLTALIDAVTGVVSAGDWVVLSGSMPPGITPDDVAAIAGPVANAGAHLAIDTSGDALRDAVAVRPRLIKPNRSELCEIVGHDIGSISDALAAAHEVHERGVEYVLVSLGADGAVLVTGSGEFVGESRVDHPRSTVGAGDCFLAGFLQRFAQDESDPGAALLDALAWGAAAASLPGTSVPAPADIRATNVRLVWQPDPDRPLLAS